MECKDLDVLCSGSELLIVRVSINANFKIPPMLHGGSRNGLHMNGTIRTVRNEQGGGEGFPTEVEVVRVPSPNEGALSVAEDVLITPASGPMATWREARRRARHRAFRRARRATFAAFAGPAADPDNTACEGGQPARVKA